MSTDAPTPPSVKYTSEWQFRHYIRAACPWLMEEPLACVMEFVSWLLTQPDEEVWQFNHFEDTQRLVFKHDDYAVSFDVAGRANVCIMDVSASASIDIILWYHDTYKKI